MNHLAFAASDLDDIEGRKQNWLDAGFDVVEIDHGWCTSIYTNDPNGILVEWCTDTKPYTAEDRAPRTRAAEHGRTRARVAADAVVPQGAHEGRRARVTPAARPVIGWREWVGLPGLGVEWVKAKVDTGAKSSSLHAFDIDVDDAAGVVRFRVHPMQDDDSIVIDTHASLVERREVRSSNGEVEVRPVIRTRAVVSGQEIDIDLSLADRDEMGFRMLLGRSAVRRRFVVDPARSFIGGGDRFSRPSGVNG